MPAFPAERIAWLTSVAVVGFLALRLPGSQAQREPDLDFTRTVADIHRQISLNYVDATDSAILRESAIRGMIANLDPYSEYIPPAEQQAFNDSLELTFRGVGIQLSQRTDELEVLTPIDDTPAARAGVQAGDVITGVNGKPIAGIPHQEVIDKQIKGIVGSSVTLTVRRVTGEKLDLTMERAEVVQPTVKGFSRNADNSWNYYLTPATSSSTTAPGVKTAEGAPKVAYIRITEFTGDTAPRFTEVVRKLVEQKLDGLVLDLRNNPGGRIDEAVAVADLFLSSGTIVTTGRRDQPRDSYMAVAGGTLPDFPLAVLVNGQSASASEILAGALADNRRATIVGSRSFGKGCFQVPIELGKDEGTLKLTVGYYYLPSGRLLHRTKEAKVWGIDPTVSIPLDPQADLALYTARNEAENYRRPPVPPSTGPATKVATTSPVGTASTSPTTTSAMEPPKDVQLQAALEAVLTQSLANTHATIRPAK